MRARRRLALVVFVAIVAVAAALVISTDRTTRRIPAGTGGSTVVAPPHPRPPKRFGVGSLTLRIPEPERTTTLGNGESEPRVLETVVLYPAQAPPSAGAVANAPAASASGPFPLVVFGHGFDTTPALYSGLLNAWVRAGYVVAAPVFPGESAGAAGGVTEVDLPEEPTDFKYVISAVQRASREPSGTLAGLVRAGSVAVSGQSDGGDAALAAAYDPAFRDGRIDAAAILSGAEIPQLGPFTFASPGPPLLAVQGTADRINLPNETYAYFGAAPRPKYLLKLLGAEHLPPYTSDRRQLRVVEQWTLTFFDAYLRHNAHSLEALASSARGPAWTLLSLP